MKYIMTYEEISLNPKKWISNYYDKKLNKSLSCIDFKDEIRYFLLDISDASIKTELDEASNLRLRYLFLLKNDIDSNFVEERIKEIKGRIKDINKNFNVYYSHILYTNDNDSDDTQNILVIIISKDKIKDKTIYNINKCT